MYKTITTKKINACELWMIPTKKLKILTIERIFKLMNSPNLAYETRSNNTVAKYKLRKHRLKRQGFLIETISLTNRGFVYEMSYL